jgi:hypothetical protein
VRGRKIELFPANVASAHGAFFSHGLAGPTNLLNGGI